MEEQNIVRVGDHVILKKEKSMKVYNVIRKMKVFMEKRHFCLDPIIGHAFGTTWELKSGNLVPVTDEEESHDIASQIAEGGSDNRAIVDDQKSQKLDLAAISDLKEQGKSGQEIIDHLIENSSTFNERTVYSKAKYLKKKKNRHIMRFVVLKPSSRLLCQHFFLKSHNKHLQIRLDSLSQILTAGNLQSGSKVMVYENCQGLLVGAIMERLGGNGTIVQFHSEDRPNHTALDMYNFPKHFKDSLKLFNLKDVYSNLITLDEDKGQNGDAGEPSIDREDSSPRVPSSTRVEDAPMVIDNRTEEPDGKDFAPQKAVWNDDRAATLISGSGTKGIETEVPSPDVESDSEGQVRTLNCGNTDSLVEDMDRSDALDGNNHSAGQTSSISDHTADGRSGGKGEMIEKDLESTGPPSPDSLKRKQREEERMERKRVRLEEFAKLKESLLEKNMDSLLIATKHHPGPILLALIDLLAWSRPFIIFSPYIETLKECYVKLRDRGGVINLNLTETWYRDYQVLPNRTHPLVTMSGNGGYLLTGIHVAKE